MPSKAVQQSDKMTERELLILKMRFGIDMPNQDTWTLHQIAKIFNISYERVRQIEARALKKLSKNPKRIHNLFSGSKISGLISVINKNMTPKIIDKK